MPLSDKYYKTKDSGNGWVLDVLHDEQPEELAKYCERGRDARAKKKARQRKRPLNKHSGAPHPTYRASSRVHIRRRRVAVVVRRSHARQTDDRVVGCDTGACQHRSRS